MGIGETGQYLGHFGCPRGGETGQAPVVGSLWYDVRHPAARATVTLVNDSRISALWTLGDMSLRIQYHLIDWGARFSLLPSGPELVKTSCPGVLRLEFNGIVYHTHEGYLWRITGKRKLLGTCDPWVTHDELRKALKAAILADTAEQLGD